MRYAWIERHKGYCPVSVQCEAMSPSGSDRRSQYCRADFQAALSAYGMRFATRRAAIDKVIDSMSFYNHRRLHSTLAYVSPMQVEQHWFVDQGKRAKSEPHDGLGYGMH